MKNEADLKQAYGEIVSLYDWADKLIGTVEEAPKGAREEHFQAVSPLVAQLEASADILTEEFIAILEKEGRKVPRNKKTKIEKALRNIYAKLDEYQKKAKQQKKQALASVSNIVDSMLDTIKQQVEKVITIFVGFVELSLEQIMHKADLEKLRKQEAVIDDLMQRATVAAAKT